jgi:hypothetical protein
MSQLPTFQCPAALIVGLGVGFGGLLAIQRLFATIADRHSTHDDCAGE